MAKKHWKNTENEPTAENVALDLNKFISTQTDLSVGWEIEDEDGVSERWVQMLSWYDGVKFSFSVDMTRDLTDLYQIQKELYDYCKLWNKKETRDHFETAKHKAAMGW